MDRPEIPAIVRVADGALVLIFQDGSMLRVEPYGRISAARRRAALSNTGARRPDEVKAHNPENLPAET